MVETTFATIKELAQARDMSVLIVEQNVKAITSIVDRVYVLRNGAIVLEESGEQAQQREIWWDLFDAPTVVVGGGIVGLATAGVADAIRTARRRAGEGAALAAHQTGATAASSTRDLLPPGSLKAESRCGAPGDEEVLRRAGHPVRGARQAGRRDPAGRAAGAGRAGRARAGERRAGAAAPAGQVAEREPHCARWRRCTSDHRHGSTSARWRRRWPG